MSSKRMHRTLARRITGMLCEQKCVHQASAVIKLAHIPVHHNSSMRSARTAAAVADNAIIAITLRPKNAAAV
jgi:hypothetical protein